MVDTADGLAETLGGHREIAAGTEPLGGARVLRTIPGRRPAPEGRTNARSRPATHLSVDPTMVPRPATDTRQNAATDPHNCSSGIIRSD
jgi:hypothetical protein